MVDDYSKEKETVVEDLNEEELDEALEKGSVRLFVLCLLAKNEQKQEGEIRTALAVSSGKGAAIAAIVEKALEWWPEADGWETALDSVLEIPDRAVELAYISMQNRKIITSQEIN